MFNFIKKMFSKNKVIEDTINKNRERLDEDVESRPEDVDCSVYDLPSISGNIDAKYNMLLMDDFEEQFTLYNLDFKRLKRDNVMDINKEFKIYNAKGINAGFETCKLLNTDVIIDVALLDLTLETSVKLKSGELIVKDGVDIAIKLLETNPNCKFVFCTAHNLNKRDPLIQQYIAKFNKTTGLDFNDYYLSKAGDRYSKIKELTSGFSHEKD